MDFLMVRSLSAQYFSPYVLSKEPRRSSSFPDLKVVAKFLCYSLPADLRRDFVGESAGQTLQTFRCNFSSD